MKILMVNKFLNRAGGAETYMINLGDYLASLGHKVEYFGMDSEDRCVSNSINCYTDTVNFRNSDAVAKIKYSLKSIYSKEAESKIEQVIKDFKPDIVHLNNINFQLTPSVIYAIKKFNIPIVQTVHDVQIACPNHRMYNEQTEKICDICKNKKYLNCIKNKCVHGSTLKSAAAALESYYYHKRDTYNLVDCYICPSRFMAETIEAAGVHKNKLNVIHNFALEQVNLEPKDKSEKYILYFGRLSVEKGIKTLLEVCKELNEIHFVFAGTGPLSDLCKIISNINCVGFKSGDELNRLIRNAAFSVYPSEWYENCPMSILESISLGTPVLCSDLGGSKELVVPGRTGEIFKAYDKADLIRKIKALYNNTELLEKMSKICEMQNENTINQYANKVISIYENLIEEKKW